MASGPRLSESAQHIRPGVFAELQRHIDAYAARGGEMIPLHIGDTHLGPPPSAHFAAALDDDPAAASMYRYGSTLGLPELREAIAARLRSRGFGDVDGAHHVHVTAGATHALFCAARAVLDPGDEVLVAAPYWPLCTGIFHACSARPVEVPLTNLLYADGARDAAEGFAAALTPRTKALYLITPNNPDGKVLTRGQLAQIAAFAEEHDLWVFADEVYADVVFSEPEAPHVSIASLPGMARRTISVFSFSKSHALAGARVGYVVAPAEVITAVRRVSTHTVFNVPVVMQRAALGALLSGDDWVEAARDTYRTARDTAVAALAGSNVRFAVAEGGSYLFLDFAPALHGLPLHVLLERAIDRGVLLAPGDAFGRAYGTCARLCYTSVPAARVVEGIARLRDAVESVEHEEQPASRRPQGR
jgi:aspartate/methionine/tyrosine aminotransferase